MAGSPFPTAALAFAQHERDQLRDSPVLLDRMPKWKLGPHLVAIPTTVANSLKVPRLFQIGDDALDGSLRDPYEDGDVSHPRIRLPGNAKKDVRVVGEKCPGSARLYPPPSHRLLHCRHLAGSAGFSQRTTS